MTPDKWTRPRYTADLACNFAQGSRTAKVTGSAAVHWTPEVGSPGPGVPITPRKGRILVRACVVVANDVMKTTNVAVRALLDDVAVGESVHVYLRPGWRSTIPLLIDIILPRGKTSIVGILVTASSDGVSVLPGSVIVLQELGAPGDSCEFILG